MAAGVLKIFGTKVSYLLFINRVCFSYSKILRPRSVRKDRGLNILHYEKETWLINSLLDGQEMREGQPSLKGFCDLGLKLESCWVTHRQEDVDRFLYLQAISHLIKRFTNRYTYQSCNCFLDSSFLIFMTLCYDFTCLHSSEKMKYSRPITA